MCFHQDYAMMTNTELNAVSDLHQRLPKFEDMAYTLHLLLEFSIKFLPTSFDLRSLLYLGYVNFQELTAYVP